MKAIDRQFTRQVLKTTGLIFLAVVLCRFSGGVFTVALVGAAVMAAMQNKLAFALSCYLLFPFMVIMNPGVFPKSGLSALALRFGPWLVTAALVLSSSRRAGTHVLPLAGLFGYMVVAAMSSIGGYAPFVSFLKIVNFLILMFGMWLGLKNIDKRTKEVLKAREVLLAIACFLIFGSLFTAIFLPGIGYLNTANQLMTENPNLTKEELAILVAQYSGVRLFAGVTNQSQCLAVFLPATLAWVACDMLFVERRVTPLHTALIFCGLPLIYLTRSRGALLTTTLATCAIYFYCLSKISISPKLKRAFRSGMTGLLVIAIIGAVVAQVKDKSISRWLRKSDDVAGDTRSLGEAMTSSRMGLMETSMADFRKNPLLGMGFQVAEIHKTFTSKMVFSAPIEKGVLPVMVLGETGVAGALTFLIFLVTFYTGCFRKRYVVTATLFTVLLGTNMGEATFFSPGGVGGMMWTVCVAGGFVIDTIVISRRRQEVAFNGSWRRR